MKNDAFYKNNLFEGDNPQIEEFINNLFLSLEHAQKNEKLNNELVEKVIIMHIYYYLIH